MSRTAHCRLFSHLHTFLQFLISILIPAQNLRPHIPRPFLLLRIRPGKLARPTRLLWIIISKHTRQLLQRPQPAQARHTAEKTVARVHGRVLPAILGVVPLTVPQILLDADVQAAQVCEGSRGGAKGAVPVFLVACVVDSNV